MPVTAAERLLRNPFDPAQALPRVWAEFLRELRKQFGNLDLPLPPTMPVRGGCGAGLRESGHCHRRRKPTSGS